MKKRTGNLKHSKFLKKQGFTLIELVVVMAIIAVLAVLVIGAINIARHTAIETTNRSNAHTLRSCLEAYYAKYRVYCNPNYTAGDFSLGYVSCSNQGFSTIAAAMNSSGIVCKLSNTSSMAGGGNVQGLTAQGGELWIYNWDSTNPSMEKIPVP